MNLNEQQLIFTIDSSCIPENKDFHQPSSESEQPFVYSVVAMPKEEVNLFTENLFTSLNLNYFLNLFQRLLCPPAINFYLLTRNGSGQASPIIQKLLLRGDSTGRIALWLLSEPTNKDFQNVEKTTEIPPTSIHSLTSAWKSMTPSPCGILDQIVRSFGFLLNERYKIPFFLDTSERGKRL